MGDGTKIEWTDATWNVVTGCSAVSPGCTNCYAARLAGGRLRNHPSRQSLVRPTAHGPKWTGQVRFNHYWLDMPLRLQRPRKIFVAAHGDLFHESVPYKWVDRVWSVMSRAPRHVFQVLTKRPERMKNYIVRHCDHAPLRNVWLGVSVEDELRAWERIPVLLETPAAVRFLSLEPLLGPVELDGMSLEPWPSFVGVHPHHSGTLNVLSGEWWPGENAIEGECAGPVTGLPAIDWVIAGGESGPRARPMDARWVRYIRDDCIISGTPFFFKQWGGFGPQAGGRLLDGAEWNQVPQSTATR